MCNITFFSLTVVQIRLNHNVNVTMALQQLIDGRLIMQVDE